MVRVLYLAMVFGLIPSPVFGDDGIAPVVHGRGYKPAPPEVRKALHDAAYKRNHKRMANLQTATQPTFDCRVAFNNVLPVDDQGSCGDCFGVSAADGCSMALIKAGKLPLDDKLGRLSSQYGLDCGKFDGGCGGGDEAQVIEEIMRNGFPTTNDYGPYTARRGTCKQGLQTWKILNYGYCTPGQEQGIAATQDIKNAMVAYGPISVAFDARGCDGYSWPQTMTGSGSNVDHAVLCIGWDDTHDNGDGSTGAFLGMNQWGASWGGPNGTFWIKYGAYSWGTEAIWMDAGAVPPAPTPPVSPTALPTWLSAIISIVLSIISGYVGYHVGKRSVGR